MRVQRPSVPCPSVCLGYAANSTPVLAEPEPPARQPFAGERQRRRVRTARASRAPCVRDGDRASAPRARVRVTGRARAHRSTPPPQRFRRHRRESVAVLARAAARRGPPAPVEAQRVGALSRRTPLQATPRRVGGPDAVHSNDHRTPILHHRLDRPRDPLAPSRPRPAASSWWRPPRCDSSARSTRHGRPSARDPRPPR